MIRQIGGSAPFIKSQLTLQALKPAAERRASELRQRCGLGDVEAQQGKAVSRLTDANVVELVQLLQERELVTLHLSGQGYLLQ